MFSKNRSFLLRVSTPAPNKAKECPKCGGCSLKPLELSRRKGPWAFILRVNLLPALLKCHRRDCTIPFCLQGSRCKSVKGHRKDKCHSFKIYMIAFLGASGAPECEAWKNVKRRAPFLYSHCVCFLHCALQGGVSASRRLCQCHFLVTFLP